MGVRVCGRCGARLPCPCAGRPPRGEYVARRLAALHLDALRTHLAHVDRALARIRARTT